MHQSQRACEGWLAVFPCVPNGETVMDFSIDYMCTHFACNCMRVKASWVSDHYIQSFYIHHEAYSQNSMWKEALYQVWGILMMTEIRNLTNYLLPFHFTLVLFIFRLIQVWFLLSRHFLLFVCLDLFKMAKSGCLFQWSRLLEVCGFHNDRR